MGFRGITALVQDECVRESDEGIAVLRTEHGPIGHEILLSSLGDDAIYLRSRWKCAPDPSLLRKNGTLGTTPEAQTAYSHAPNVASGSAERLQSPVETGDWLFGGFL